MNRTSKELLFLKSALTKDNPFMATDEVLAWLKYRNEQVRVNIERVKFKDMNMWGFEQESGNLVHETGRFFSIEGIRVKTNWGGNPEWSQPIINQPEIGFLGIITKEIDGILYFLMQAKIEPGNVNYVQLSPTLQATKSNYTQVHKGKKPMYLDYFLDRKNNRVLLDQLQSEQGARFWKKRNRNIIIQVDSQRDIEQHDDFVWLTLGQLKKLIQMDNIVNMDTRTVISGIPFGNYSSEVVDFYNSIGASSGKNQRNNSSTGKIQQSLSFKKGMLKSMLDEENSLLDFDDIISWLTQQKSIYELEVKRIPLKKVNNWLQDDYRIYHEQEKYFQVIGVNVEIGNREVVSWMQPLVEPVQRGICVFIVKKVNGIYHFLVQSKLECGNFDILELAPTVQCLTGNYRKTKEGSLPFLEYVLNAKEEQIRYQAYQSEEGGRFYREQNKNIIMEADNDFPIDDLPANYNWITLNQLITFLKFNNYLNIQARSLISAVNFI